MGNGGNIRDFEGIGKSTHPTPPFVAINTTAGTGSEMTRFCIITNTDTHVKMAIGYSSRFHLPIVNTSMAACRK